MTRRRLPSLVLPVASLATLALLIVAAPAATASARPPTQTRAQPQSQQQTHDANSHVPVLRAKLQARLADVAQRLDGVMGYAIVDLTTGERFGAREDEVFPTASTIKLGILYELFLRVDAGTVRLDDPQPVPESARVGGSGLLNQLTTPRLSLRDHAILMMLISDNTSTNVLIDTLGLASIQARLDSLGLNNTKLRRHMMDLAAARRGDENVSTPAEIARLLARFHTGEGLSARSKDDALAILSKPKSTAMTRTLPAGLKIASKEGGLEGVKVDAGIVMLDRRPYIFVAMCTYLKRDDDGDAAIGETSRAVFDYFNRLGAEGAFGRVIQ